MLCVCVREREERRFVQYQKSQAVQLKIRNKKSVEVQINEEEVGGAESYLVCRPISEIELEDERNEVVNAEVNSRTNSV